MRVVRMFAAAVGLAIAVAFPAMASGLKTHLWIADQILRDLQPDCALTINGGSYAVPTDKCRAILDNPKAFRAGSLGPDAYPDIVTGQVTVHPGSENGWQTADWLRHVYNSATTPEEIAFASGYLVHAATDTFAHTYVNAYAGDVFELTDERAVELRHFVLEKYVDSLLPGGAPDPDTMDVPAEFVAETLILNDRAYGAYDGVGAASHIRAMNAVYRSVGEMEDGLDNIEENIASVVDLLAGQYADLGVRLATGEAQLQIAEESLRIREQALAIEQNVYDEAERALNQAVDAVERNEHIISQAQVDIVAADQAIDLAHRTTAEAIDQIARWEGIVSDLEREIANVPARACHEVGERICRACGRLCGSLCRTVTRTVCSPTDAWSRLNAEIGRSRRQLTRERDRLAHATNSIARNELKRANALNAQARSVALREGLSAARLASDSAFQIVRVRYEAELALTTTARNEARAARERIAEIRQAIVDIDSLRAKLRELIEHSDLLSGFAHNWRTGIEVAAREYVETGETVSKSLAGGDGDGFSAYRRWLTCYGSAFTPVPYQFGEFGCDILDFYADMKAELEGFLLDNLPEPAASLFREYISVREAFYGEVDRVSKAAAVELAKLAAPDQTTREFIEALAYPETATGARLDEIFREEGDSGGKRLLIFENVTDLVNADLGLTNGRLDPQAFLALRHAMTLSRLSLLDAPTIDRLIWRLGGDPVATPRPERSGGYSLLFEMLRSIDGNHQWQPFGLPYGRSDGVLDPVPPAERHFGYGPADGGPSGSPLFIDPDTRRRVFLRLFPDGVSRVLRTRPELNGAYPFPECARNPYPVTFIEDGETYGAPATEDRSCQQAATESRWTILGDRIVRGWRAFLDAIGLAPKFNQTRGASR